MLVKPGPQPAGVSKQAAERSRTKFTLSSLKTSLRKKRTDRYCFAARKKERSDLWKTILNSGEPETRIYPAYARDKKLCPWTVVKIPRDFNRGCCRQALTGSRMQPGGSPPVSNKFKGTVTHGTGGVSFCTQSRSKREFITRRARRFEDFKSSACSRRSDETDSHLSTSSRRRLRELPRPSREASFQTASIFTAQYLKLGWRECGSNSDRVSLFVMP